MALGTNYARPSAKEDQRIRLGFIRLDQRWNTKDIQAEWRVVYRRKVAEITAYVDLVELGNKTVNVHNITHSYHHDIKIHELEQCGFPAITHWNKDLSGYTITLLESESPTLYEETFYIDMETT